MVKQLKRKYQLVYERTIGKCCVIYGLFIYHTKIHIFNETLAQNFHCYGCLPIPLLRIRTNAQLQECYSVSLIQRVKEKVHLSETDAAFFQTTKNHIQSLVKKVWEVNLEVVWDEFTYKNRLRH